eukprot:CAMPEP_0169469006 /NCGR_PEP_ID=MMETSP1042-20121227/23232_1 /TAXON_ID=464988 /ORGANISM="Hemiselmis andersenii, Strain CCMP1180" /LENGTH=59 /DNA_ID=CAMNT_0009582419 /DNA_START=728 /DNA_END=904 /DNA_ORIENTATION=+
MGATAGVVWPPAPCTIEPPPARVCATPALPSSPLTPPSRSTEEADTGQGKRRELARRSS